MWRKFLSTPSARRATEFFGRRRDRCFISIHALREEGDPITQSSMPRTLYFYPRPPRGGRPHTYALKYYLFEFLSTPSARRATRNKPSRPAQEGDFYPRPPRGGRPDKAVLRYIAIIFLSTPSARRATKEITAEILAIGISIHALREEGDSKNRDKISIFKQIIQHSARI